MTDADRSPVNGADAAAERLTPRQWSALTASRRVVSLEELDAMVASDQAGGRLGYCASCGPLVEVDDPFRREVRHRRGCPAREV